MIKKRNFFTILIIFLSYKSSLPSLSPQTVFFPQKSEILRTINKESLKNLKRKDPFQKEVNSPPQKKRSKYSLKNRSEKNQRFRVYSCKACGLRSDCFSAWKNHRKLHKIEELLIEFYQCNACEKKFLKPIGLKNHICNRSIHMEGISYQCKACQKKFLNLIGLKNHICDGSEDLQKKLNQCEYCPYKTDNISDLKRHVNLNHLFDCERIPEIRVYHCSICEKTFKNFSLYNEHKDFHCKELFQLLKKPSETHQHNEEIPDDIPLSQIVNFSQNKVFCQNNVKIPESIPRPPALNFSQNKVLNEKFLLVQKDKQLFLLKLQSLDLSQQAESPQYYQCELCLMRLEKNELILKKHKQKHLENLFEVCNNELKMIEESNRLRKEKHLENLFEVCNNELNRFS